MDNNSAIECFAKRNNLTLVTLDTGVKEATVDGVTFARLYEDDGLFFVDEDFMEQSVTSEKLANLVLE